jgi:FkbM family methyltransferase
MVMRPHAYTLVSTDHGTMIVNRFDYRMIDENRGYGVGFQLLNTGQYDMQEMDFAKFILGQLLESRGEGVVAIDCGANIGVHTIEWAKFLHNRGHVIAFEPQESVYYALCGNLAINNCFNVNAYNAAVGDSSGVIEIPKPNYFRPSTFGSMELKQHDGSENIGQSLTDMAKVEQVSIDSMGLSRVDFMKIDVEGMEFDAVAGAADTIEKHKPQMLIENIKIDKDKMKVWLEDWGYDVYPFGGNFFAVHKSDTMASKCSLNNGNLRIG